MMNSPKEMLAGAGEGEKPEEGGLLPEVGLAGAGEGEKPEEGGLLPEVGATY